MIKIRTTGNFAAQFSAEVARGKKRRMEELVNDLKIATPVDTGEARDGWHIEGDSIVNRVDHIGALNHGTSKQAPTHFVESTLLSHKDIIPSGTIVRSE